jgi:dihydropteroate synthase
MTSTRLTVQSTRIGKTEFRWGQRTYVMGVINVTPDSFSGDGLAGEPDAAVAQALAFQEAGADIIDVGGESTRPTGAVYGAGAAPISPEEELARVLPVVQRLKGRLRIPISVDTYKAEVARQAVAAGAALVNDVWALKADPDLARVVAECGAPIVLMHNQRGTEYGDLLRDVVADLRRSVERALAAGVPEEGVLVDPGIGFGKTPAQNLELLRRLGELKAALGRPLVVGTSRKSTIGIVLGGLPPQERLAGTAATVALAIAQGADVVRVHDVKEMVRVARMSDAIVRGWSPP